MNPWLVPGALSVLLVMAIVRFIYLGNQYDEMMQAHRRRVRRRRMRQAGIEPVTKRLAGRGRNDWQNS